MESLTISDQIAELERVVQQLENESNIERMKVSIAADALIQFCEKHGPEDPLLTGIPASVNPFKEKKSCILL